ncbi:MAG: helix-turn-helix domain-containing protein [Bacteroidales bacterium]|nr:helix-turn-helix domain-containing protein [Bacteroidales bacterium]MCM1146717.1 helix-turn-helix domain-containing protein [Bacteroidales bacterium]MCM1205534.1 helix-turn-helix domain-containing protein [Bacillota bacterium]MCM1509204.1 helix-turn-helix domain-containing protein [Clostridium sp.]
MPETLTIYDTLLRLPLFQGMSSSDLQEIVSRIRFGFRRHSRNTTVISEGTPCEGLLFLLDGETEIISTAADRSYNVTEELPAPCVIEPERVFGLRQHYLRTYRTRSTAHFLHIRKDDTMLLTSEFMVFRLNLLNVLSAQSQKFLHEQWRSHAGDDSERIRRFLVSRCAIPSGRKLFRIKMRQLAAETGLTRNEVSLVLNTLENEGKLTLRRGIIDVPDIKILQQ